MDKPMESREKGPLTGHRRVGGVGSPHRFSTWQEALTAAQSLLSESQGDLAKRTAVAREIRIKAALMQKQTRRALPLLRQAAEAPPGDAGPPTARADYLKATQVMARSQQAYAIAEAQINQAETISPALAASRQKV